MDAEEKPLFDIPLYRLRIARVSEVLRLHGVQKILDFGCGEGKLMLFLREDELFRRLVGVDLDIVSLRKAAVVLQPLISHQLHPRLTSLSIELFHGSVGFVDPSLIGIDAVASIEVIEHLDPPILEQFRHTVFEHFRPSLVVITTPNSDFNVFFPELAIQGRFRHPDHRFEWSRAEFQNWCTKTAEEFAYSVRFEGIGFHPNGDLEPGACSQMAVFLRQTAAPSITSAVIDTTTTAVDPLLQPLGSMAFYEKVVKIDFPSIRDPAQATRALVWSELKLKQEVLLNDERFYQTAHETSTPLTMSLDELMQIPRINQLCEADTNCLRTWLGIFDDKMPMMLMSDQTVVTALQQQEEEDYSEDNDEAQTEYDLPPPPLPQTDFW